MELNCPASSAVKGVGTATAHGGTLCSHIHSQRSAQGTAAPARGDPEWMATEEEAKGHYLGVEPLAAKPTCPECGVFLYTRTEHRDEQPCTPGISLLFKVAWSWLTS